MYEVRKFEMYKKSKGLPKYVLLASRIRLLFRAARCRFDFLEFEFDSSIISSCVGCTDALAVLIVSDKVDCLVVLIGCFYAL